jgi:hypothetical protein
MIGLDLTPLLAAKGGRPLGVSVALGAIFLPSSLLVYLTRPDLYQRYGIAGGVFFSAAVGFPVVCACCLPWYSVFWAAVKQESLYRRITEAALPTPPQPEPTMLDKATADDPLEWPTLLTGGWTASGVLYGLVALAYYRPILLGATLLLTVGIVLAVWLVLVVLVSFALKRLEREVQKSIDDVQRAASAMRAAAAR